MNSEIDEPSARGRVVVVFGSTGTAGNGAVHACLADPGVAEVRAVTRRPLGSSHPALVEVMCSDFADLSPIARHLRGVDTCLFCLGSSARKVSGEAQYREIHVTYALAAARSLKEESPGASFVYLSGAGTHRDSRMMWARVKAEAEDRLAELGLTHHVNVRPGFILPVAPTGLSRWLLKPLLGLAPPLGIRAEDLGRAMLRAGLDHSLGAESITLANRELRELAGP
ncbi:MAG: epimerase [Deltaproteobacteria bacterium]|nr:epimerase [Deltaproteobacteria bacterium]